MPSQKELFSIQMMLDGVQIYEELGSSLLGSVYRISHPAAGNCVLKCFEGHVTSQQEFLESYFGNIKKLKQIEHPNIAKVYQIHDKDTFFIIRELVLGKTLREYLKEHKKINYAKATQFVLDIAMGLLAGYPFKIVYKNLKPENIIIQPNEVIKLVDISLPPTEGVYLSPEVWNKEQSTIRSDIYTLGIIYYEMLTGTLPFQKASKEQLKQHHLKIDISLDSLANETPNDISEILKIMLSKDPEERYRSPLPLIGALREVLKNIGAEIKSGMTTAALKIQEKMDKEEQNREAMPPNPKFHTGMMVAFTPEMIKQKDGKEIDTRKTIKLSAESIDTRFLKLKDVEDSSDRVYLTKKSLEDNIEKALNRITFMDDSKKREKALSNRIIHFPKGFEDQIIEHLINTFRRECWLLKDSDKVGEMEVEIDLEQGCILQHFFKYEDLLQGAIVEEEIEFDDQANEHKIDNITEILEKAKEKALEKTLNLEEEEVIVLEEENSQIDRANMRTINMDEKEIVSLEAPLEAPKEGNIPTIKINTISDITISPGYTKETSDGKKELQ